jgi:SRSO17 transposase
MTEQQLSELEPALADFLTPLLGCCRYAPTARHLGTYVRGLLSDLPRKTAEPLALRAGIAVRTLQEFLRDHAWDAPALTQALRARAALRLADIDDPIPDHTGLGTVGLIDETSAVKDGDKTPGVQRQYLGCVGKVDNGIVTVHLALARGHYKALLDSELYLPQSWAEDRDRCRAAAIPDEVVYRPKWQIALELIERTRADGVKLDWLTFDEEYGKRVGLDESLSERGLLFVGEVPRNFSCIAVPRSGRRPGEGVKGRPAEEVVSTASTFRGQTWQILRLIRQTQGEQIWRVKAARVWLSSGEGVSTRAYWLIWASNDQTGEEKFFLSNAAEDASIEQLVRVAFVRWNVEHVFRVAKSELGFTHFEGRSYLALMRHVALCQAALNFVSEQTQGMRLGGGKCGDNGGAGVPRGGGTDEAVAGPAARHPGVRARVGATVGQAGSSVPPETQPRRAAVAPEPTSARAARPQEAATTRTAPTATLPGRVDVALYY